MNSDFVEICDDRFKPFLPAECRLEKLYSGMQWAEGPAYVTSGAYLVFSDIPNNVMYKWSEEDGITVFRKPADFSNGNTTDRSGRLLTCEHGTRRVIRTEKDGSITIIADRYKNMRFNSPNDLTVKSDGSIWFTDPSYGILSDEEGYEAESEIGRCNVYCVDPDSGAVSLVADDFEMPNGIAFSPDEKLLYVSDTGISHRPDGPHHIRVFDVVDTGESAGAGASRDADDSRANGDIGKDVDAGGDAGSTGSAGEAGTAGAQPPAKLINSRIFVDVVPGVSDGFRLDVDGNVWTSAGDGVHCYSPGAELLGKILVPEIVANVEFGGPDKKTLFITATTSLYSIRLNQRGVR